MVFGYGWLSSIEFFGGIILTLQSPKMLTQRIDRIGHFLVADKMADRYRKRHDGLPRIPRSDVAED